MQIHVSFFVFFFFFFKSLSGLGLKLSWNCWELLLWGLRLESRQEIILPVKKTSQRVVSVADVEFNVNEYIYIYNLM